MTSVSGDARELIAVDAAPGWFAPGRIEVLGKHTDYAGGRVLICAIDRGVSVRCAPAAQEGVLATTDADTQPVRLRAGMDAGLPPGHWGRYLQVVLDRLTDNFGPLAPCALSITSDLPLASGMSSSSALVVATAMALVRANGLDASELWRGQIPDALSLATYLACVENGSSFGQLTGRGGVGTFGGSEDHTAMLCSRPGRLGMFSFSPAALVDTVAVPDGWSFVVGVSGVHAEKTGPALASYNRAALSIAEILRRWNDATGRADTRLALAVDSDAGAVERLSALVTDDDYLGRRLGQFVAESTRLVPGAFAALAACDVDAFGAHVAESQRWAGVGLENQVPQTEALVASALDLGAGAASSFGAGFGGSVWALVPSSGAQDFAQAWLASYRFAFPQEGARAATLVTTASGPAHAL